MSPSIAIRTWLIKVLAVVRIKHQLVRRPAGNLDRTVARHGRGWLERFEHPIGRLFGVLGVADGVVPGFAA